MTTVNTQPVNSASVPAVPGEAPADPNMTPTEQHDRRVWADIRHAFRKVPGVKLPAANEIRITTGFSEGRRPGRNIHAEAVSGDMMPDGVPVVFISPLLKSDTLEGQRAIYLALLREMTRLSVYAEHTDAKDPRRPKILQAALNAVGITRGGKIDATPEATESTIALIDTALKRHGSRPFPGMDPFERQNIRKNHKFLSGTCHYCGGKRQLTSARLAANFEECAGNGKHNRVFLTVVDDSGAQILPGDVVGISNVTDNGDGTYSPKY